MGAHHLTRLHMRMQALPLDLLMAYRTRPIPMSAVDFQKVRPFVWPSSSSSSVCHNAFSVASLLRVLFASCHFVLLLLACLLPFIRWFGWCGARSLSLARLVT